MSAWSIALAITFVLGVVASGRPRTRDTDPHAERRAAWAMIVAGVSIVGFAVSVQLSDLPIDAFRMTLVAATVVFAVATIHRSARRLIQLARSQPPHHEE